MNNELELHSDNNTLESSIILSEDNPLLRSMNENTTYSQANINNKSKHFEEKEALYFERQSRRLAFEVRKFDKLQLKKDRECERVQIIQRRTAARENELKRQKSILSKADPNMHYLNSEFSLLNDSFNNFDISRHKIERNDYPSDKAILSKKRNDQSYNSKVLSSFPDPRNIYVDLTDFEEVKKRENIQYDSSITHTKESMDLVSNCVIHNDDVKNDLSQFRLHQESLEVMNEVLIESNVLNEDKRLFMVNFFCGYESK